MSLIKKINSYDLYEMACEMGRGKDFGSKGWHALGEYLEELSDSIGEDIEIDVIALCCDYSMVESVDSFVSEFQEFMDSIDPEDWGEMSEDEKLETIEDYLSYRTNLVICEKDCIIWQAF